MKEIAKLIAETIKREDADSSLWYKKALQETNEATKAKYNTFMYAASHCVEELKKILVEVATKINIEE